MDVLIVKEIYLVKHAQSNGVESLCRLSLISKKPPFLKMFCCFYFLCTYSVMSNIILVLWREVDCMQSFKAAKHLGTNQHSLTSVTIEQI